jgi:hypothetical protein
MVVIRENGPSFKIPGEFACNAEQRAVQNVEALRRAKMMSLKVSSCSDEIGTAL